MSANDPARRMACSTPSLFASALCVLVMALPATAQQEQGGGQGQNQGQGQGQGQRRGQGGGRRGQGGGDPAQFRQRMDDRMKQALGATDEEWAVLKPKVDKVTAAQRQSGGGRGAGFGGPGGGGRRGGGPGGGGDANGQPGGAGGGARPQDDSPVAVKSRELRQAMEANASPEELKTKMAALRDARVKARQQLEQARAELKELLTAKQEAALLMMGVLE